MIVRESLAIVVAPAIVSLRLHPLQVRAAHSLYVRVLMIPVAGSTVVLLAVVALICMRTAAATAFIIGGNPCIVGIELAVRAEIQRPEIARTVPVATVVNHNVRHRTAVTPLERTDQQTQVSLAAKRTIQIAVLTGDITRTVTVGCGRKPHQVKVLT